MKTNFKTVLAEKPSVAEYLARHVNANHRHDGYFEGNGYHVTWTFGHLVQLSLPNDYEWTPDLSNLPFVPSPFILKASTQGSSTKQLNVISKLFKSSDEIIVATDAAREGELIFRYVYHYLKCKLPFKRLWISSMTPEAIAKGWQSLVDGSEYDTLYHSAKARKEADWIIGLNASIALTQSARAISPLSLGRVQTPVLAMICSRYKENREFVSSTFYVPELCLQFNDTTILIKYKGEAILSRAQAQGLLDTIGDKISCIDFSCDTSYPRQPQLFDLTLLQRFANKKLGLTAKKTLASVQSLYEKKLVTYPRTDSKYISEDIFNDISDILTSLLVLPYIDEGHQSFLMKDLPRFCVDDNKISDHHAIIPTGILPDSLPKPLTSQEAQLYQFIVRRIYAAFGPNCEKQTAKALFDHQFRFTESRIVEPGWQTFEKPAVDQDQKEILESELPEFHPGHIYRIIEKNISEGQTKPRPIYTDDTLLNAMETCGKDLDDDKLKEALKSKGIGTPATRADILETLIQREYVARKAKQLIPSQLGLDIHEAIADLSITSPEMTGDWESQLTAIANGDQDPLAFLENIRAYTEKLIPQIIAAGPSIKSDSRLELQCPKCQNHQLTEAKFTFRCPDSSCGFKLNKTIASKKLTNPQIESLVKKKTTALISGFHKKEGKGTFSAYLIIDERGIVHFKFKDFNKKSDHACPCCQSSIVMNDFGAFCDKCGLKIFRKVSGKRLSDKHINQLLQEGKTEKICGFRYKSGNGRFDAIIKIENGKTVFSK